MKKLLIAASFLILLSFFTLWGTAEEEKELITDYTSLMSAISSAKEGDVLLVGDIDFSPTSPDIPNSYMNIALDKSITLKSGKEDAAVFLNGGFLLSGSKVSKETISCHFENIVFDGKADSLALTADDFKYPWSEAEQQYKHTVPMKAQQALSFKGNVDASFTDCVFKNYMHEYGTVIDIRYGDYTDNAYLLNIFGDQSGCAVNLSFQGCRIENNSVLYDGGAIYIDSNKNVTLTATDCIFVGNSSGNSVFDVGGGAIYAKGAMLSLINCAFAKNIGNRHYDGEALPDFDTNRGGAIYLEAGNLSMVNCTVKENRASMGGAIALTNSKADIDGCFFTANRAEGVAENPDNTIGPWSNMGQGGALYVEGNNGATVTLINSTFKNNTAVAAYGGIYGYYTPHDDPTLGNYHLKMILCSYEENTVDTNYDYTVKEIYPWASHPGDLFTIPYFTLYGCFITDNTFLVDFPRSESPSFENSYNYFAPISDDSVRTFSIPLSDVQKHLGDRYGDRLNEIHIGSNYSEALYKKETDIPIDPPPSSYPPIISEEPTVSPFESVDVPSEKPTVLPSENPKDDPVMSKKGEDPWWILFVVIFLLLGGGIFFLHFKKKETRMEVSPVSILEEKPTVVLTRYNDADIERILSLLPEVFTAREQEVLREILHGKKQGEVAYYLGIEVSTVKDHYKRIYGKLNVQNKEELFIKIAEILNNQ